MTGTRAKRLGRAVIVAAAAATVVAAGWSAAARGGDTAAKRPVTIRVDAKTSRSHFRAAPSRPARRSASSFATAAPCPTTS